MAGSKKTTELAQIVTIDVADILPIVDTSVPETKFISVQQLDDRYLNHGIDFNTEWENRWALKDSDNLPEGSVNLYYTDTKVTNHPQVAANSAARHDAVTLDQANGLSIAPFSQVVSMAIADAITIGALSPTDWNTFNNKQDALPNADGSTDGILTSVDWNTFNNKLDGSPYDGLESEFSGLLDNQAASTPVTGLQFNPNVRLAVIMLSVEVDATTATYDSYLFLALNKGGVWEMTEIGSGGDASGINLTISGSGQVEYTSPPIDGFSSGKVKYRYFTLTI